MDAPVAWVRSFLLAGTTDDDTTVDGDVVEVRQHDHLLHLVVRNTLTPHEDGGTRLEVEASLRLHGLARLVGGVFRGRVRRTLERSLDRLPTAIEQALAQQDSTAGQADEPPFDRYEQVIVDGSDHLREAPAMSDQQRAEQTERHDATATTVSEASQDAAREADDRVPEGARETLEKTAAEAAAGEGIGDAVKRVGREVDRTFSGEYEAREDRAAAPEPETKPQ